MAGQQLGKRFWLPVLCVTLCIKFNWTLWVVHLNTFLFTIQATKHFNMNVFMACETEAAAQVMVFLIHLASELRVWLEA